MCVWLVGCGFAAPVRHHSFIAIDHEIFSTAILSHMLIQTNTQYYIVKVSGCLNLVFGNMMHWDAMGCQP